MKKLFLWLLILIFFIGCATREDETIVYPQESYSSSYPSNETYSSNFSKNENFYKKTYSTYSSSSNKGTSKPYYVNGKLYVPKKHVPIGWTQEGIASWYGPNFHGRYTSNGEIYNMYDYTAAHKTLPMNTRVKVTNLNNGKSVIVRINDRGPFVKNRIIDLSYAAGKAIGIDKTGTAPVRLEVIGFGDKDYVDGYMIQVGAFLRYEGAKITAKKYKKLGYNTKIENINGLNKVFITGFSSYDEAKKFKLKNNINGFIVGD